VATGLLVLTAVLPRFMPVSSPAPSGKAGQVSEHLEYLIATSTSAVAPARAAAPSATRAESRYADTSLPRDRMPTSREDSVGSASKAGVPLVSTTTEHAAPNAGDRLTARAVSPLLWPNASAANETTTGIASLSDAADGLPSGVSAGFSRRRHEPIDFDSALRSVHDNLAAMLSGGQLKRLPLKQTDLDAQARAKALASIAARGAGVPIAHGIAGGGHIDTPLPFGGPSRKQRIRDSTINAQTKETLARVQRRLDSAMATRERRLTDSLAHVEDSLRGDTRPLH
jgi:hypothetical protein